MLEAIFAVVLPKSGLINAVRDSISIPGIFTPVKKNGTFLVSGGLVNSVPVSVVGQRDR